MTTLRVAIAILLAASLAAAQEAPAPFIGNGGFEAATIESWSLFGEAAKRPEVALVQEGAHEGRQAVRMTNKTPGFGGLQVPLKGIEGVSAPLFVSVSVRRDAAGAERPNYTFGISFNVRYQDGTPKWESPQQGWLDPTATQWQTRSFVWTPPKPISAMQVRIMFIDAGSCLFDAVTIRPATKAEIEAAAKSAAAPAPAAGGLPASAKPADIQESFDGGKLPDFLLPHIGEWQVSGGALRTSGPMPEAGWYIRGRHQYQYDEVSFRVRKDSPGGILYFHTRHWKLMLRANEMMVKNVAQPNWWLTCTRPISFADTQWHTLKLTFAADRLGMSWDGVALADWTSPAGEYKGKPYDHWLADLKLSFKDSDEIFVLHPYQTGAQFDDLRLRGSQTGDAQGFLTVLKYPSGWFVKDNAFQRLAPREPVDVDWTPPEADRPKDALPPVDGFRITRPFGPDREPKGIQCLDFRIGVDPSTSFPPALTLFKKYNAPQTIRLHLNLAKPGLYTLKAPIGVVKNLAQIFEVSVDGKPVSREVYRGLNSSALVGNEGILDYVPLRLSAGYHRIDLAMLSDLADRTNGSTFWKYLRVGFNNESGVELVPGHVRPEWTLSAKRPQPAAAFESMPKETEWNSKEIRARITDLPDGPCVVRLGFQEVVLDSAGERLMDIAVNGQTVAKAFDIVKEAGADLTYITRDFPATVKDGSLLVEIIGLNFQACVNYVEIRRGDQTLFRHNAGWAPRFANWGYYARYGEKENAAGNTLAIHADPAMNAAPMKDFEGHNFVANPSFTLAEDDAARPLIWRSATELAQDKDARRRNPAFQQTVGDYKIAELTGTGDYARDPKVFRSAPAALRVGATAGSFGLTSHFMYVDYAKRQKLTAWVKADRAQGKARLALYWFALDYYDSQFGLKYRFMGKDLSERFVTGTQDWTELSVTARPPFGAIVGAMVLVVDDNAAGAFWFDDVSLDGYGAEPIELTLSHLGFHPNGVRRILVKTLAAGDVRYVIRDEKGADVLKGAAKPLGEGKLPDRFNYEIDAATLTKTGRYTVEAAQGAAVARASFVISPDVYQRLMDVFSEGYSIQRMNVEVPGWHGPTHLDDYCSWMAVHARFDYQIKLTGKTRQGLGGYHDAGDRIKHWTLVSSLGYGAMNSADAAGDPVRAAQWRDWMLVALDSLAGAQLEDGYFFAANKPYAYDDIPLYGIERYDRQRVAVPHAAGIFARAALMLKDSDPARAAAYRAAAERVYRATSYSWSALSLGNEALPCNQLLIVPKMLFAELYLGKLTGDPAYRAALDADLVRLCDLLEKRVYLEPVFRRAGETTQYVMGVPINFDFLWVATYLLRDMPDHPQAPRLRQALLVFVKDIDRLSSIEPWGQAMDLEKEGRPAARFPSPQPISYWTMLAGGLARLGMALDRPDIVRLGERQLQWALGCNPYDICTVPGVGDHFAGTGLMQYLEPEFYNARLKSKEKLVYAPGSVSKTAFRNWGTSSYPHPTGFAYMPLATDYAVDPGPMEYWQMMMGNFASGAAAMREATDWLAQKGR